MNQHLTDEQFAELLSGDYSHGETSHLNTCETCSEELKRARGAILDFSAVTLRAAQERSATMAVPPRSGTSLLWVQRTVWTSIAAGAIVSTMVGVHQFKAAQTTNTVRAVAIHDDAEKDRQLIAEDNALLSAIDADLRWESGAAVETPAATVSANADRRSQGVVRE